MKQSLQGAFDDREMRGCLLAKDDLIVCIWVHHKM